MPTTCLNKIFEDEIIKGVVSNPLSSAKFRRINISKYKDGIYKIEKLIQKQAFSENAEKSALFGAVCEMTKEYRQLDFWSETAHYTLLISKKGKASLVTKKGGATAQSHNRKKNYILNEAIPPLIDLGIFTKDGKIVNSMYDKFKQINRFTEIVGDVVGDKKKMTVLDFGCGKSYLTFILYYYLTEIRGIEAEIIGLDLKDDVIKNCNALAEKYGYKKLRFETGDIGKFDYEGKVDMIITLHACDIATDYALYNAIKWNCGVILSVPCCQHELNSRIETENLKALTRYGIIKERFSALATDAIRGNLLMSAGYSVDVMEFVDMAHSPKNILIRAKKALIPQKIRDKAKDEVEKLMKEFSFSPKLYNLMYGDENNAV